MELRLDTNLADTIVLPMVDSATPASFKTGLTVAAAGYFKDGAGAWTTLTPGNAVAELGATGQYALDLTAAELNHDRIIIKFTAAGAADTSLVIRTTPAPVRLADAVSHGGTLGASTATLALSLVRATSQVANQSAVIFTGQGTGTGIQLNGGLTGIGLDLNGGGTSGAGLTIDSTTGDAVVIGSAGGNGDAIQLNPNGTGLGINGTLGTVNNLTNLPAITTNWLTATGLATDAADEIAAAAALKLLDTANDIETNITVRNALRACIALLTGQVTGAGSGTEIFKNPGATKNRATITVDANGNRSAITFDFS